MNGPHTNAEPPALTRSKDIWFDDGNIVLQADSTQFRIHRSILSKHSDIFRDMFAVAQPDGAHTDWVDGCPPVVMYGDEAANWEDVLSVLYRITPLGPTDTSDPLTLPVSLLTSVLRLGKKYQFDALYVEARSVFIARFPSSVEEFDRLTTWSEECTDHCRWIIYNMHAILSLADEARIQCVLPVTYYIALSSRYQSEAGSTIFDQPLPLHHLLALSAGRIKLSEAMIDDVFGWIHDREVSGYIPTKNCQNTVKCTAWRVEILRLLYRRAFLVNHALDGWDDLSDDRPLCGLCRSAAKRSFEEGRDLIWDKLPKFFLNSTRENFE